MSKACIAFEMDDIWEAWKHIWADSKLVINYGDRCGENYLHTWDDGCRILYHCELCGGYILLQSSEFHGMRDDDYYNDYFPVSGPEEAEELNRRWNGEEIEDNFPTRYIIQDNDRAPHWNVREDKTWR